MPNVEFEFYNGTVDHEKIFKKRIRGKCPTYLPNVDSCLKNGIAIQRMAFYTYGLFEDYNPKNAFFSSFKSFAKNARIRAAELNNIFEFKKSIKFHVNGNPKQMIAYGGCGIALNTSNAIFDLTHADYVRIPEKPGRPKAGTKPGSAQTLDFEYKASSGAFFIRVECKGKKEVQVVSLAK